MAEGDLAVIEFVIGSVENFQTSFGFQSISAVADWRQIVLDGFVALVVPILIEAVSGDLSLIEVRCKDVKPGTGPDVFWEPPAFTPGGQSGRPVAPQCAGKIRWLTNLQGRNHRGANYFAGLPLSWTASDTSEFGVEWNSFANDVGNTMLTAYGPDGTSTFGRFVVISRWEDGVARSEPVGVQIVDWDRITPVRTQRRRQHS